MNWKTATLACAAMVLVCACAMKQQQQNLVGTWYVGGNPAKACVISSKPQGLIAKNESGSTSKISMESGTKCTALDWDGGVRGEVNEDRILWSNGTWWSRTAKQW